MIYDLPFRASKKCLSKMIYHGTPSVLEPVLVDAILMMQWHNDKQSKNDFRQIYRGYPARRALSSMREPGGRALLAGYPRHMGIPSVIFTDITSSTKVVQNHRWSTKLQWKQMHICIQHRARWWHIICKQMMPNFRSHWYAGQALELWWNFLVTYQWISPGVPLSTWIHFNPSMDM